MRRASRFVVLAIVLLAGCGRGPDDAGAPAETASPPVVAPTPDSLLVLPSRIGRIELGMTLEEARAALPTATFTRASDGEGAALVEVRLGHGEHLVLAAGEDDPATPIDWTRPIVFIEAYGPEFRTAEGVGPGSHIEDVESLYGGTMEIRRSEIESREFISFERGPRGLVFRLNYSGEFPPGASVTTQYAPGAALYSIAIPGPDWP